MTGSRPSGTGSSSEGNSCESSYSDGSFNSLVQSVNSTNASSEKSSMKSSSQKEGLLRVLIDADGCFYNERYRNLMNRFIENNAALSRQVANQESVPLNTSAIILKHLDYAQLKKHRILNLLKSSDNQELNCFWKESNFDLTGFLLQGFRQYSDVVISIGSNRQSYQDDLNGCWCNSTSSIFSDLPAYTDYLKSFSTSANVRFDPATMTDFNNNLAHGETYMRIHNKSDEHADYLWDEKKGSLIYAMAHHSHVDAANAGISQSTLLFVDDRHDILDGLFKLYREVPELLPAGCTLRLVNYDGRVQKQYPDISGTGELDKNYAETASRMARDCVVRVAGDREIADVVGVLCGEYKSHGGKSSHSILPASVTKSWLKTSSTGWYDEYINSNPGLFVSGNKELSARPVLVMDGCNVAQAP